MYGKAGKRVKGIAALLAAMILCVMAVTSYGAATVLTSAGLEIGALGRAECESYYTVSASEANSCKVVCELQYFRDGRWQTVQSWEQTAYLSAYLSPTYYVYSGYAYRVLTTGYAYLNGSLVDTSTAISKTVFY